jgi:sugar diacid utilization regulator
VGAAVNEQESPADVQPGPAFDDTGTGTRDQLSSLQGLLVLSMLMTERADDKEILRLVAKAVPSLGRCRLVGVYLVDDEAGTFSNPTLNAAVTSEEDALVKAQLAVVDTAGGPVGMAGAGWAWAYPLRSLGGNFGYLVARADGHPDTHEQFLLRVLALQAGTALANARSHRRERETAVALRAVNAALEESVAAFERGTLIHDRLTRVAVAGEGQEGIADALHELTGFAVAIEDRHGNLVTWAGHGRPDPYPRASPDRREDLLRQMKAGAPFRRNGRLMCMARPRHDVVGLIALVDPDERCGSAEQVALEHAATVLSIELARAHSIAEAELRLGRDLADELLGGSDEVTCMTRANALGYDLSRPHRVVVLSFPQTDAGSGARDRLFHAVLRAARDTGIQGLQVVRLGTVVLLCGADGNWHDLLVAVDGDLGDQRCRLGVGGRCERPADFVRSHREAQLALSLVRTDGHENDRVMTFDDLGLLRLLLSVEDTNTLEHFVRATLATLLDYDANKGSLLVSTLGAFLERGGNYDSTSRALCVHRSTLKYRLHRIEELSGHDLSSPDVRFNLQLAVRAWQSLSARREPAAN